APTAGGAKETSAQHYVDGLRARIAGDGLLAAEHLSHALSGHADACRAAGEYVAALRALKRHPDATVFNTLRADNSGCVNLPPTPSRPLLGLGRGAAAARVVLAALGVVAVLAVVGPLLLVVAHVDVDELRDRVVADALDAHRAREVAHHERRHARD